MAHAAPPHQISQRPPCVVDSEERQLEQAALRVLRTLSLSLVLAHFQLSSPVLVAATPSEPIAQQRLITLHYRRRSPRRCLEHRRCLPRRCQVAAYLRRLRGAGNGSEKDMPCPHEARSLQGGGAEYNLNFAGVPFCPTSIGGHRLHRDLRARQVIDPTPSWMAAKRNVTESRRRKFIS